MNKFFTRGVLMFRRLSVFYLFFLFMILAFILYQYKVKPDNEAELHNRGQRVLKQLAQNFLQKDKDIKAVFSDPTCSFERIKFKKDNLNKFNEKTPYNVDTVNFSKDYLPGLRDTVPFIRMLQDDNWQMVYPVHIKERGPFEILVNANSFAGPIFGAKEDVLFGTFLILFDSNSTALSARNLPVIYRHNNISASPVVNLDTLKLLQKNSDLSAVTDIAIAGSTYKIFVHPFRYYGQRVLLAGLISSENYSRLVNTTPLTFVPVFIISILLLLIFLPFLKLFFLSPHESVNLKDLRAVAVSFYLGAAVVVLIVFYLLANLFLSESYDQQLVCIGNALHADIEKEIGLADKQLKRLDELYPGLDTQKKKYLAYDSSDKKFSETFTSATDAELAPAYFKNASRMFWIDEEGNTIAKWNAFDFVAPLTSVKEYEFFKRIGYTYPKSGENKKLDQPVKMYFGKSNATNEFQAYFSRPSNDSVYSKLVKAPVRAYAICLAGSLSCSKSILLPAGFGFCIINKQGDVLVHSDPDRNLSENILAESGTDVFLRLAIERKNSERFSNIRMYGAEMSARIIPIENQALSIVTYYDKNVVSDQVLQTIQFTSVIFGVLLICVAFCLWLATYVTERPMRLLFKINHIEWIRPSKINDYSYSITNSYFTTLGLLYMISFLVLVLINYNLTALGYLSVLLPFYCLLGYLCAKSKTIFIAHMNIRSIVLYPLLFIIFSNFVIVLFMMPASVPVFLKEFMPAFIFQVFALLALKFLSTYYKMETITDKIKNDTSSESLYNRYFYSLGCSLLLLSLFPVIGILMYSWSAQNIQIKKAELLKQATDFEARSVYFRNEMSNDYKPSVLATLGDDVFSDDKAFRRGIYLPDGEELHPIDTRPDRMDCTDARLTGDELYYALNEHPVSVSANGEGIPVQDRASDNSWQFFRDRNKGLLQLYYSNADSSIKEIPVLASVQIHNPLMNVFDGWKLSTLLIVLMTSVIVLLAIKLIRSVINKLFLQSYTSSGKINPNTAFLAEIFRTTPRKDSYLDKIIFPNPVTVDFFAIEYEADKLQVENDYAPEEIIIGMMDCFSPAYEAIWQLLPPDEQYVLFDFSQDRLTNYKNTDILFRLIRKGILVNRSGTLDVFAPSFRNYILTKSGTPAITALNNKYELPGVWSSIKIPAFSLMAVIGIFILFTQTEITHRITGFFASIAALLPLVLKLFDSSGKKISADGK